MTPRKPATAKAPDAEKAITAQGVTLQKIDTEGAAVGEPQRLADVIGTLDVEPNDLPETDAPEPGATMEFGTSDPAAVELARQLTRIPIPTAVIAQWFPAYFRTADPGAQPWPTCKVFLTPQGLYVYRATPAESETFDTGATPTWYAGVDFAETAKPVTGYAAMNAGIPITTSAGQVNVQPYGGCGCNARKLKNWTPSWARNRISWDDAVKLTDTTAGR